MALIWGDYGRTKCELYNELREDVVKTLPRRVTEDTERQQVEYIYSRSHNSMAPLHVNISF